MGWIAKPGSAEDKLKRWLTSKNQLRVALWFTALLCGLYAWSMFDVLKPTWRVLVVVPLLFGAAAILASHHLKRTEKPTRLTWAVSLFLALPAAVAIIANNEIIGSVAAALQ